MSFFYYKINVANILLIKLYSKPTVTNGPINAAKAQDIERIKLIYNQGIRNRIAMLEENETNNADMEERCSNRSKRFLVLVTVGLIKIECEKRGEGIGKWLLKEIAMQQELYKLILFTFPFNELGQDLYRSVW